MCESYIRDLFVKVVKFFNEFFYDIGKKMILIKENLLLYWFVYM